MSTIRSKDRASLCSFTFSDSRQCRTPRQANHHLCAFHARKEAQAVAGEQAGENIAHCLSGSYVSACSLSAALARLFSAVAQGHLKPKTANTLAYLSQTLAQTLHHAEHEYINAFGSESWRKVVRSSFVLEKRTPEQLPATNQPQIPKTAA